MTYEQINMHGYTMTQESMDDLIEHQIQIGASGNTVRRLKATLRLVYEFLPEDKMLTRQRLLEWRADMNERGYASQTVQNYVKWLNIYLDHVGQAHLKFNRGKGKDISGMEFGFIKAIEPTDKRDRGDVIWRCRCRCGTELELTATRLILNNTLSCGCLQKEAIKRTNKYFDGTSLEKSLNDTVTSARSMSGYVGVTRKKDKWQAYITYKKKRIYLGTYDHLEDAVKARARGKEEVMEDASELLKLYDEIHKDDTALPSRASAPQRDLSYDSRVVNDQPTTAAKRSDNTSGCTGIEFRKNRWETRICYKKIRYMLGRFESREEAIEARRTAEELLKKDPEAFVEYYSKTCRQYAV